MKLPVDIRYNKKSVIVGLILILLGLSAPFFLNVENFRVYDILFKSLEERDKSLLLVAGLYLVVLNGIRGLPHYLGALLISETLEISYKGNKIPFIKGIVAVMIIPIVYYLIEIVHNIKYDLGVPAFIVIIGIFFIEKMDFSKISFLKKALIIILLLLGVQWLDIIPQLCFLGLGRGETSQDLKSIAFFMGGDDILGFFSFIFFGLFTLTSILVTKLILDEQRIVMANEEKEKVQRELNESRLKALEARYYVELKNLVHDLKTPLTSIQALTSIIKLMEENPKIKVYLSKIEGSVDNLSGMISEILYENKKKPISVGDLFKNISSQISDFNMSKNIVYNINCEEKYLFANKIRLMRAIINLLDNSYNALKDENGEIKIIVYSKADKVYIDIRDNGIGIDEENISKVALRGVSLRESTGIGLSFVKDVVDKHEGVFIIKSRLDQGTLARIILEEVKYD